MKKSQLILAVCVELAVHGIAVAAPDMTLIQFARKHQLAHDAQKAAQSAQESQRPAAADAAKAASAPPPQADAKSGSN